MKNTYNKIVGKITVKECDKKQKLLRYRVNKAWKYREEIKELKRKIAELNNNLDELKIKFGSIKGDTGFFCPICSQGFRTAFGRAIDMSIPYKIESWVVLRDKAITTYFKCKRCGTEWH